MMKTSLILAIIGVVVLLLGFTALYSYVAGIVVAVVLFAIAGFMLKKEKESTGGGTPPTPSGPPAPPSV